MRFVFIIAIAILPVAIFVMANSGIGLAQAQQASPEPKADNGPEVGTVNLSWEALPGAVGYTVGWLAHEDFEANRNGDAWKKYFAYSNVGDVPEWTVHQLTPGIDSWFIICDRSFSTCTSWTRLTLAAGPACPTAGRDTMPTPMTGDADTDRAALVALYSATGGSNWVNRANWLSDQPLGEWYGVVTDDSGRVVELRLRNNNLNGQLPTAVGSIVELILLDL